MADDIQEQKVRILRVLALQKVDADCGLRRIERDILIRMAWTDHPKYAAAVDAETQAAALR